MSVRPFYFITCAVLVLSFSSCELFEEKPDADMVRDVTRRTIEYIEWLYGQKYQEVAAGGVGTVIQVTTGPAGYTPMTISMTITSYSVDAETGVKYAGDVSMSGWSGDGSIPYVELTGSGTFSYDSSDFSRTLAGKFHQDIGEEENTIDDIEYDIALDDQYYVTGTIKADGVTFSYSGERL